MSEHTSFRYPYILIHAPFQNPSIKTHPWSIYQFPYSPSISSLFTTRIDRNPHHHRSHPISRWSIIHDGIESIAFPPRQTPIIIFITSPRNARFSFLEFFFLPPISHPSSRCTVYRVTFFVRIWLLEKAGLGRRPLPPFAARRAEGLSFAVYVYAARSLHDPDNKLPRSGCIKPGRKGETGEVGRYAALNGKSVNVVNRNKRGATRSFRLRKHKTTRGVFVNEVTLS